MLKLRLSLRVVSEPAAASDVYENSSKEPSEGELKKEISVVP